MIPILNSAADPIAQANILIKNDHRACLADFGLSAIAFVVPHASGDTIGTFQVPTEAGTSLMRHTPGGTERWTSPELHDPERFGLNHNRPTKQSDCYALGMVVYEVRRRAIVLQCPK